MPPPNIELTINSDAPLALHVEHLHQLDQSSIDAPGYIHLTLFGSTPMTPSIAAGYLAAIQRCQHAGSKIVASAHTPLLGPIAYLWILADLRRLAPAAYLAVLSGCSGSTAGALCFNAESHLDSLRTEGERAAQDYCLRIISEYVDPEYIHDRVLQRQDLAELLLIGPLPDCIADPCESPVPKTPSINPRQDSFTPSP